MPDLLNYEELAEICRSADDEAEALHDMPAFFEARGVDMNALSEVAIQRALRVCMQLAEIPLPKDVRVIQTPMLVRLPPHLRDLVPAFAATYVDGFNGGMSAQEKVNG